jgi:hypothetical protein
MSNGSDRAVGCASIELSSDARNQHIEASRRALRDVAPNHLENVVARDDSTVAPRQSHDYLELTCRQCGRLSIHEDDALIAIDADSSEVAGRVGPSRRPASEGAYPRYKLGRGEWLTQVVVSASIQPPNAILYFVVRRQQQDRKVVSIVPDRPAQLEPRPIWQPHVDDREVGGRRRYLRAGCGAITRDANEMAGPGQDARDRMSDARAIFDDQNAHPLKGTLEAGWGPNSTPKSARGPVRAFSGRARGRDG